MPMQRKRDERVFISFIASAQRPRQSAIAYLIKHASRGTATFIPTANMEHFLIKTLNRTHRSALAAWSMIINIGILTESGVSSGSAGARLRIPRPEASRESHGAVFYRGSTDSLITIAKSGLPRREAQWRGGDPIRGPRFARLLAPV
jgi:hypothetical protein